MSEVEEHLQLISSLLHGLDGSELEIVNRCEKELLAVIEKYGSLGFIAFSVIGMRLALELHDIEPC